MPSCELKIVLEGHRLAFGPGDVVQGMVEVQVDRDVRCDGLTLELQWRTHGKGNTDRKVVLSRDLFRGPWRAGAVERYAFSFELPAGPFTFHGHYLNVVWELVARANVPWASDPWARREITLVADPAAEPDWWTAVGEADRLPEEIRPRSLQGSDDELESPLHGPRGKMSLGCCLIIVAPVALLVVLKGLSLYREGISREQIYLWTGIGAVLALVSLYITFQLVRNRIAQKKLGEVTFEVRPLQIRAGQVLEVVVSCQPRERSQLVSTTATLTAEEIVVRGSGTNRSTYWHKLYTEEMQLAAGRSLSPGLPFQATAAFNLPADAPPTFAAHDNRLVWTVELRVDIDRWPDWVDKRLILVHP